MPDTWTLVTPTGNYTLNRTFHAPKYQPGGVDTNAALRRDGRTTYQRSGDGLPTPGPLVLRGRVWNDARDIAALIDELEAIQEAAATCIEVIRVTDAGRYVYDDLSGGPPPEVVPDGLGGWEVTLELWPGRAAPAFVPTPKGGEYVGGTSATSTGSDDIEILIPEEAQFGDELYLFAASRASMTPPADWSDPPGWERVGGRQEIPTVSAGVVWRRTAQAGDATTPITLSSTAPLAHALAICVAVRGFTFEGVWRFAQQSSVNVPVELLPGDLFAAFAFSSDNAAAGPRDLDGVFPQVLHPVVGFNPAFHGAFICGEAPAITTQVFIAHEHGTGLASIAVFT